MMKGIVLVDDHVLLRNGLASLIESFGDYNVLFQADNGRDFVEALHSDNLPQIVLMDINMPLMDGYETTYWLKKNYPLVKVLALSMYDNENSIIRMFRAGAKGYILKDCDPAELKEALNALITKGFYYSEMITGQLIHSINIFDENESQVETVIKLNDKEILFLNYPCPDLPYKENAGAIFLSQKTID